MQRALGAVNHFVDLVPRMVELLFGFTSATIGFAFGFKVLVAGETSGSLFDVALHLISLCTRRALPFFVVESAAAPGWTGTHFLLWRRRPRPTDGNCSP
jgi:hypothetical protein